MTGRRPELLGMTGRRPELLGMTGALIGPAPFALRAGRLRTYAVSASASGRVRPSSGCSVPGFQRSGSSSQATVHPGFSRAPHPLRSGPT